jgi:hypothetical protein
LSAGVSNTLAPSHLVVGQVHGNDGAVGDQRARHCQAALPPEAAVPQHHLRQHARAVAQWRGKGHGAALAQRVVLRLQAMGVFLTALQAARRAGQLGQHLALRLDGQAGVRSTLTAL